MHLLEDLRTDNYPFLSGQTFPNPQVTAIHTRRLNQIPKTLVHLRLERLVNIPKAFITSPAAVLDDILALPRLETLSVLGPLLSQEVYGHPTDPGDRVR